MKQLPRQPTQELQQERHKVIPQSWNDVGPAWTVEAGLPGYACMVLVYANPKDAGQTGHPLRRIILIVIASVEGADLRFQS